MKMKDTQQAIKNWANGLVTTQEMINTAKANGYKLTRENAVMYATKGWASFSQRLTVSP